MEIIFFILVGVFGLLGLGLINSGSLKKYKNPALVAGGVSYLSGAIFAYAFDNWWPFLIAFICAWGVNLFAGGRYSN